MEKVVINISLISVLLFSVDVIFSEKLPDFIEPCNQNDSDINQCFINRSIKAIPQLIKEDILQGLDGIYFIGFGGIAPIHIKCLPTRASELKTWNTIKITSVDYLKIPILSPLRLRKIELINTDNLKLSFENLTAFGLGTAKTLDAKVDLLKRTIATDIHFDKIEFEGTYVVNGKILILPIFGSGSAKITFDDVLIRFSTDFELKSKNETEYMHLMNSTITYDLKHATYQLKGLFNGDEVLAKQTNKFLNENWEPLHEEFAPIISKSIKRTVLNILERIVDVIPFSEIFVPE